MSDFQDTILKKLDEQTKLLGTISTDIALLKKADTTLELDGKAQMDRIKGLESRIQFLERLTFFGFILIVIMAVKLGLGYLLNVK